MSKRKRKAEREPTDDAAGGGASASSRVSKSEESDAAAAGGPTSEYEQRRQQQIARNQALLSSLTGLTDVSTSFSAVSAAAAAESKRVANAAAKVARDKRKAERAQLVSLLPRRDLPTRSTRATVNYTEERIVDSASSSSAAARNHDENDEDNEDDQEPRKNADLSDFVVPDSAGLGRISASGATRSAQHTFTLPLPSLAPYIGRTIPLLYHTPKAAAMSFLFAGWPEESNKQARKPPPTFNKMSGIQKLANHVALFINVDEEEASSSRSYDNQWQNGGRQITWFAQPTQRVDTPVIGVIIAAARARKERIENANAEDEYVRRILPAALQHQPSSSSSAAPASSSASNGKVKKEIRVKQENESPEEPASKKSKKAEFTENSTSSAAANSSLAVIGDASADPKSVLLFLRFAGSSYLYAGSLAYHSHDTTRTPMKFVFTLSEYDKLVQQEDFLNLLPKSVRAQASGSSSKSSK